MYALKVCHIGKNSLEAGHSCTAVHLHSSETAQEAFVKSRTALCSKQQLFTKADLQMA